MNHGSIGVFDSGLGGLTAVKELKKLLPLEKIVYFGDTGRVPYGTRSRETVIKYARQDIRFLLSFPIKAILVACGTVSSIALPHIEGEFSLPLIGVVDSTSKKAARVSVNRKIGVIGTPGTIGSGAYEKTLKSIDPSVQTVSAACPLFVPAVENGRFLPGDVIAETLAAEYLEPIRKAGVDTLILGCTHYPLLKQVIGNFMGRGVALIDSGVEAALAMRDALEASDSLCACTAPGETLFFVSDSVHNFSGLAGIFLGEDIGSCVKKIDIEKY